MPYARPTLTQLRDGVLQDIQAAQLTSGSGQLLVALLQKAVLRVVAYAQAGLSYEHYEYLDFISRMAVPWTAETEFLEGWAALKGVYRKQATATVASISFANPSNVNLPQGTPISRGTDGFAYTTIADGITTSGTVVVHAAANVAGSTGNFDANTAFTLSNGIPAINAGSTASSQITAGADTELDDSLRNRMLLQYAAPPQGGDAADYIEWALSVPGVTRAWINPNGMGAGTVVLYVMLDIAEAIHGGFPQGSNGVATNEPRDTPATGDQLTVANAIFPLRPVTALVYVNAPTAQPVNFTINNLGTNNTGAMQTAITAALQDMFLRLANVGGTVNPRAGLDAWPPLDPSSWYAALEAIQGLVNFTVAAPSAPVTPTSGHLLTLGTITFNT